MTLQEIWNLVESLNDTAKEKAKDLWLSDDIDSAISYQTECFKDAFLKLEQVQQQAIIQWAKKDDEFQDYIKCLAGNDFIIDHF